jgi:hypothetical protein
MNNATNAQSSEAGAAMANADAAIEYYQNIIQQIDDVQNEFEKIKRVGEIVKNIMSRVESLDRKL